MEHFAGIDVSLEQSSVCVVDAAGKIVREARVASEPEAVRFFRELGVRVSRIGLEAGPLSQWLHAGLAEAGFDAVLLETHVKAALSAMVVKTDRKDARGIAQLLRMGWFRPVHAKSPAAQEIRALLVARKLLQAKLLDVELSIRGILRGFGLKMGEVSKARFVARVRELVAGQAMLERIVTPMLRAREALRTEYCRLHREMLAIVKHDAVPRQAGHRFRGKPAVRPRRQTAVGQFLNASVSGRQGPPHHAIRWEPVSQSRNTWSCLVGGHSRTCGFAGSFVPAAGPRGNGSLLAPPRKTSTLFTHPLSPRCLRGGADLLAPAEVGSVEPHAMQNGRQLAGEGNLGALQAGAAWPGRGPSASGWKTVSPGSA